MTNPAPRKTAPPRPAGEKPRPRTAAPVRPASSVGAKKRPAGAAPRNRQQTGLPAFLQGVDWQRGLMTAAADIVLIALGLVIFAYFHHVKPVKYSTEDAVHVERPTAAVSTTAAPQESAQSGPTATPDPNDWGAKFAGKFTSGGIEQTKSSYKSENVSITIERHENAEEELVWFVADIYLRDIESYRTAFAREEYGKGYLEWPAFMGLDHNAILAVSGDYYGAREEGVVIRNGTIYRSSTFKDVCLLYYDGVMETMTADEFDVDEAIARGVYQGFSFGPALLNEDGHVRTDFDSEITDPNPRCAIGYYEPGHYCFVVVDGRQPGYTEGATLEQLAQIFRDMGCTEAYNLDGGKTAVMVFMNEIVNQPYDGGRKVSDIVYIGEVAP